MNSEPGEWLRFSRLAGRTDLLVAGRLQSEPRAAFLGLKCQFFLGTRRIPPVDFL